MNYMLYNYIIHVTNSNTLPTSDAKELETTGTLDLPRHAEKNDIWALGTLSVFVSG